MNTLSYVVIFTIYSVACTSGLNCETCNDGISCATCADTHVLKAAADGNNTCATGDQPYLSKNMYAL